jgi:hypothetical protein
VDKWIEEELRKTDPEFERDKDRDTRRFDLLCIRDELRIMILELMRPREPADYDHLMRLNRCVTRVRASINNSDTRVEYRHKVVRGLLIADLFVEDASLKDTLNILAAILDAVTWDRFFQNVSARYREFLDLLKLKAPNDLRLKGLIIPALSPEASQTQIK